MNAADVNKKHPPPLPPPRPYRHERSSSLDLNNFKVLGPVGQQLEIMIQASFDLQTTGFAHFSQFSDDGKHDGATAIFSTTSADSWLVIYFVHSTDAAID